MKWKMFVILCFFIQGKLRNIRDKRAVVFFIYVFIFLSRLLCVKISLPGEVKGIVVVHVPLATSPDSFETVAQEFDAGSFVVA